MRLKRVVSWIGGCFLFLVMSVIGSYYFIFDWDARPICHKAAGLGFRLWMDDLTTNAFPNIEGDSHRSLAAVRGEMGGRENWADGYKYIPGLREDDPGDLVLMYLDRPTRWTWHGAPPTIFKEKAWIVVPVDFSLGGHTPSGSGELSERISAHEVRARLRRTLDFVRTNERPDWQAVVAEHKKVLDSLEHGKP